MFFNANEAVGKLGQSAAIVRCTLTMLHLSSTRRLTVYVPIAAGVNVKESEVPVARGPDAAVMVIGAVSCRRLPELVTDQAKLVSVGYGNFEPAVVSCESLNAPRAKS
jgi:hypothetical protein